jgi:hypothetical protein
VSKAAAHNLIEKKYRSNLNEKMAALRDTIPRLRSVAENATDNADSQGANKKLNKVSTSERHSTQGPFFRRTIRC